MCDRFEGKVAALDVKGEFVNVHPAGAHQHLVILDFNISLIVDGEIRTWRGSVFLCPVWEQIQNRGLNKTTQYKGSCISNYSGFTVVRHTAACCVSAESYAL